jgi:hypothetical protein
LQSFSGLLGRATRFSAPAPDGRRWILVGATGIALLVLLATPAMAQPGPEAPVEPPAVETPPEPGAMQAGPATEPGETQPTTEAAPAAAPVAPSPAAKVELTPGRPPLVTLWPAPHPDARGSKHTPFWGPAGPIPSLASAHDNQGPQAGVWGPHIEVHADLQNLFLFRNDADFDRSEPTYDENGQSVGAFATIFRPMVTFHATPSLRLYYEAELGMNFWSKNNPDQENVLSPDVFMLKHRQVYAEGEVLDGDVGFKVGYQFLSDPTELFLGHWIGAAGAHYALGSKDRIGLFVGQVPDQTYEGINVEENNFNHDIFVFGPRADLSLSRDTKLSTAIVGLYDAQFVERTRWLIAPAMRFETSYDNFTGSVDGVVQLGKEEQAALGNEDQKIFAWAVQAHGTFEAQPTTFDLNALVLSSDDAKDGNQNSGAFVYSSRSRSATMLLTEDELRNWYDQLDRRAAAYRGGFWEHRAGLAVADVKATWAVTKVFRPALVLGGAAVLQRNNALDNRFVGVESDLDLELRASESLSAHLVGGALFPGKAASALINSIDRNATAPVYMIEASLLARY